MRKLYTYGLGCLSLLAFSCGEKAQEAKNAYEVLSNLEENSENIQEQLDDAEKKRQERIAKGDTLAIPYKELQAYLPKEISGYAPDGDPDGSTTNMSGISYSQCEQTYSNGEKSVTVSIHDYNGAYDMYSGLTALYSAGMSFENDEELARGVSLKGDKYKGWEILKKVDKRAEMFLGVGYRFYIAIEADNQENTDFIKSVAEGLNLDELAAK